MTSGRHNHMRARWPLLRIGLGGGGIAVALIIVAVGIGQVAGGRACASVLSAGTAVAGTAVAGTATHYVLSGTGNCSYQSPPADGLYVALSPSEYDRAAACGGYVQVKGPDGSVRAEVIDQCPPCASGHIDLSEAAFSRIAPLSAGLVSVVYQAVADPPLPAPVSLRVKEGSSRYWLAVLATNTGNPLASVQVKTASGDWRDLARADFNYWIASAGAGAGPFTVRLTDTAGHQVTVRGVALDPGVVQATGIWMYRAGTAPAAASAVPTSVPPATSAPTTAAGLSASGAPARRQRVAVHAVASPAAAQVPGQTPTTDTRAPPSPVAAPSC